MSVAPSELVRLATGALSRPWNLTTVTRGAKDAVRYLAAHTGLPALLVAAVLVCVGYRLLKRSMRFALEVAVVALLLVAATRFGWIRW